MVLFWDMTGVAFTELDIPIRSNRPDGHLGLSFIRKFSLTFCKLDSR